MTGKWHTQQQLYRMCQPQSLLCQVDCHDISKKWKQISLLLIHSHIVRSTSGRGKWKQKGKRKRKEKGEGKVTMKYSLLLHLTDCNQQNQRPLILHICTEYSVTQQLINGRHWNSIWPVGQTKEERVAGLTELTSLLPVTALCNTVTIVKVGDSKFNICIKIKIEDTQSLF